MRQYARIEGGKVTEVAEHPDDFKIAPAYHPSFQWIEVTDARSAPQVGWLFDRSDGVFIATRPGSEPPDPSDEVVLALEAIRGTGATVDQLIDALVGDTGRQGRIAGTR